MPPRKHPYAVHKIVAIAFFLRLLVSVLGSWLDHSEAIPQWKYTDIDYDVYMDATQKVLHGESPYERVTYRYSPVLTWLLAVGQCCCGLLGTFWRQLSGKLIFSFFDACMIYEIVAIRTVLSLSDGLQYGWYWALNPVSTYLCSRGSVDAISNYTVLLTIRLLLQSTSMNTTSVRDLSKQRWILLVAGLVFGFVLHFRLYPVIYWPAFCLFLGHHSKQQQSTLQRYTNVCYFSLATIVSFAAWTLLSYHSYGQDFLTQAVLYHLHRLDHRHNFSMHFYPIYLLKSTTTTIVSNRSFWSSSLPSLQQWTLLLLTAWKGAHRQLLLTLFLQTFIFVAFNKVITGQYFLWFFIFIPLFSWQDQGNDNNTMCMVLAVWWVLAVLCWLLTAGSLEMLGCDSYLWLWGCSVLFFVVNVVVIVWIVKSVEVSSDKRIR